MFTTEVFQNSDGQMVRLPEGFEFHSTEVAIRRQGDAVILEPIKSDTWPTGYFDRIRIDDPAFERPAQGAMPPAPKIEPS